MGSVLHVMLILRVNDETENVPREIYLPALSVNSFDSQKSIFVLNLTEVRCFPFLILLILSTIISFRVQSPKRSEQNQLLNRNFKTECTSAL